MSTLAQKIMNIYPNLTSNDFLPPPFGGTILLQDDSNGVGPYIRSWTNSNPRPTQDQLDAIQ